ncbi:MAG: 16S rRNA (cytidine(1402)-2'-O)-methyltransferase [Pseudomonadota bacterium]
MASDRPFDTESRLRGTPESSEDPKTGPGAAQPPAPGLYLIATPIGNLRDITLRALDLLGQVDEVLAEDTRVARRLLDAHGIRAKLSPYHDHNGAQRRPEIVQRIQQGETLALISDAGTPLVSDPGWKLVSDAIKADCLVVPIPGASSALAGLVASGLPSDRFLFQGFLPQKQGARRAILQELKSLSSTLIFFESAARLPNRLEEFSDVFGTERQAVIARELTKLFEEFRRDSLGALAEYYRGAGAPKGEVVILVGPAAPRSVATEADIDAALRSALAQQPLKSAALEVAEAFGLPRRDMYQRALALKDAEG